jgi:hypothetical protein
LVTQKHRSANLDESMIWIMFILKVFTIRSVRISALRPAPKVQRIVILSVPNGTVQTEGHRFRLGLSYKARAYNPP